MMNRLSSTSLDTAFLGKLEEDVSRVYIIFLVYLLWNVKDLQASSALITVIHRREHAETRRQLDALQNMRPAGAMV